MISKRDIFWDAAKVPAGLETIGRCCHEALRAYAASLGEQPYSEWRGLSTMHRENTIDAVRHIVSQFSQGITLGPKDLHSVWVTMMSARGYTYGKEKDHEKKTHPNLVPWENLSLNDKMKDRIFLNVVMAFLN